MLFYAGRPVPMWLSEDTDLPNAWGGGDPFPAAGITNLLSDIFLCILLRKNKKVLLHERKSHTAHAAHQSWFCAVGGTPIQAMGGRVPQCSPLGTPVQDLGYPHPRQDQWQDWGTLYPPKEGTRDRGGKWTDTHL